MLAIDGAGCAAHRPTPSGRSVPTGRCRRAAQAAGRTPGLRSRMSDHTAWVCVGAGAGPSSTACKGSSHAWHTIQIGPGSEICRSSRWRSPQSSQVMVTLIAPAGWHCGCYGPRARTSPPGYRPATNRRHRYPLKGRPGVAQRRWFRGFAAIGVAANSSPASFFAPRAAAESTCVAVPPVPPFGLRWSGDAGGSAAPASTATAAMWASLPDRLQARPRLSATLDVIATRHGRLPVRATTAIVPRLRRSVPVRHADPQVTRRPVGRRRVPSTVPPGGIKGEA